MSTGTQTSFEDQMKTAEEAFAKKDYEKTVEILNAARKNIPPETADTEIERIHYTLGLCFNELDKPSEANPHLKKALRLAEKTDHETGQARAFEQLGSAAYRKDDHRSAMAYFRAALAIYRKTDDKAGLARTLRDLGSLQSDLAQDSEAETNFEEAKSLFKEVDDIEGQMACITNVGLLHYRKGGPQASVKVYEKSFEEDQIEHYLLLNNAGFLKLVVHEYPGAREFLSKAEADLKSRGAMDDNAALLYLNLAIVEALEKSFDDAFTHLDEARRYFEEYPDGRAVELILCANQNEVESDGFEPFLVVEDAHKDGVIALNKAAVLARQSPDNLDEAIRIAEEGLAMDRSMAYPHYGLGWLYLRKGDAQKATTHFKRAAGLDSSNEAIRKALQTVNPYIEQKVGRNEPCPCGSGKKFKKCHGKA
jgi:tetratricopeptide (TPR) repeat protein